MKKIMMAIFVLTFALSAKSATIHWSVDNASNSKNEGTVGRGGQIWIFALGDDPYHFDHYSFNPKDNPVSLAVAPNWTPIFIDDWENLGAWDRGWAGDYSLSLNSTTSLDQWFVVIFYDTSTPQWFGFSLFYAEDDGAGEAYINHVGEIDVGQYKIGPIPEPATGLLALSGVALLVARRRKRR